MKKYTNMMVQDARMLLSATDGCNIEMHEPDNQGVSARVIGDHLDNAMGNIIERQWLINGYQEFVVVFKRDDGNSYQLNLATLTALARVGAKQILNRE